MANVPNFGYTYPLIEDQYAFKNTKVSSILAFSQSDESFYVFYNDIFNPGFWETIFKYTQDPSKAVFSVKLYPFSYSQKNPSEKKQVKVANNWTPNSMYVYTGLSQFKDLDLGKVTIKPKYNSILDYKPYTSIYLNLPFYGELELDNVIVMGKTLSVHYNVDLLTGSTTIYVDIIQEIPYTYLEHDYKGNRTIFTTNIDLGQTLPIMASANYQQFKSGLNAVGEAMLGASMMIGATGTMQEIPKKYKPVDIMEGNRVIGQTKYTDDLSPTQYKRVGEKPYQSYSGARGIYSSLTQAGNLSQISHRQIQNAQGGSGWFGSLNMYVRYERHKIIDNEIAKYSGKPLYEKRTLGNLTGMTKVSQVILDNCPLKEYEKEQVTKYLYSGVILGKSTTPTKDALSFYNSTLSGYYTDKGKLSFTDSSLSGYYTDKGKLSFTDSSLSGYYTDKEKLSFTDSSLSGYYTEKYKLSFTDSSLSGYYTGKDKLSFTDSSLSGYYTEPTTPTYYTVTVKLYKDNSLYSTKYLSYESGSTCNPNSLAISYQPTGYEIGSTSPTSSFSVYTTRTVYIYYVTPTPTYYDLTMYLYKDNSLYKTITNSYASGSTINPSSLAGSNCPSGYKVDSYSPSSSFTITSDTSLTIYYVAEVVTYTLTINLYKNLELYKTITQTLNSGTTVTPSSIASSNCPSGYEVQSYSPTSAFVISSNSVVNCYYTYPTLTKPTITYSQGTGTYKTKYMIRFDNPNSTNATIHYSGSDISSYSVNVNAGSFTYVYVDILSTTTRTYTAYFTKDGYGTSPTTTLKINPSA